jgi:uncharacterized protein (TIGR02001 family)
MKIFTLSLITSLVLSTAVAGGEIEEQNIMVTKPVAVEIADVESDFTIGANMTIASRYIWRGMEQNDNKAPALQGGIDLTYQGYYLSFWGSNVDFDGQTMELDIFGGYAGEYSGIGYNVGYIIYLTNDIPDEYEDISKEFYLGLSKEFGNYSVGGTFSYNPDGVNEDGDDGVYNIQLDASAKTLYDVTVSGSFGISDGTSTDDYYFATGVSKTIGKYDIGLTYTGYYSDALDDTTDYIVGSVSTSF